MREPVASMLFNSFVSAIGIALGKIFISILSAYAVVYFRFPFRKTCRLQVCCRPARSEARSSHTNDRASVGTLPPLAPVLYIGSHSVIQ